VKKHNGRLVYSCNTPSTLSSVAAPKLHLQQQLHQKVQSIPGEDHSRNQNRKTKKKEEKKPEKNQRDEQKKTQRDEQAEIR